jgi:hypothetical protein
MSSKTDTANDSDTAGAMVPLLTLGVPCGGATAVKWTTTEPFAQPCMVSLLHLFRSVRRCQAPVLSEQFP